MDSTRQNKVNKLLQKELGEFFQRESRTFFGGAFITVSGVRITPDLSIARVHLSIFMEKDKTKVMEKVNELKKEIRKRIGNKVGKQMRIVPNFEFFIDDSLDYVEKIENLLKK
ncbi:MAG: 30S ribosome-binding factor [Bacteroidia bacterium]|nr:30S ribosome-binding factor [Bacteroidia bacterium]